MIANKAKQAAFDPYLGPIVLPQLKPAPRFDASTRQKVYDAMEMSALQRSKIEAIVQESNLKLPGKGALHNLIVLFNSRLNGDRRPLESHTVERLYAYNLERDSDVVGYVTQVPLKGIVRDKSGGKHVSSACLDFMVFRKKRIQIVECKPLSVIRKLTAESEDWIIRDGCWTHLAYANHARDLGIEFEVYARDEIFGIELQNEEFIYEAGEGSSALPPPHILSAAIRLLAQRPHSIAEIQHEYPAFSINAAAQLLRDKRAFGFEKTFPISDEENFILYSSEPHRDVVEEEIRDSVVKNLGGLEISNPVLTASTNSIEFAKRRLDTLRSIASEKTASSRKMRELQKRVDIAIAAGQSPLEACLPKFENCGSTTCHLTKDQFQIVQEFSRRWHAGEFVGRKEAWFEFEDECARLGIRTPSRTTLNSAIRQHERQTRTLRTLGMRAYQKEKPRAAGSEVSLPVIAYGQLLVIDSSKFDQRSAPNLLTMFPGDTPVFYIGVDGASGRAMAQAMFYGKARTDGLAILLRDFVKRHGFLPRMIQVDRGPENTSQWLKDFCLQFGIHLRYAPTGGSRFNGLAENLIGRVNHYVAHCGPGSTLPDQRGREAAGRVKSRKTARADFGWLWNRFEAYAFGDHNETRDSNNLSPNDYAEDLITRGLNAGIPCAFDDSFLVSTSVEIDAPKRVRMEKGIRLTEGVYAGGNALVVALRKNHISSIRKDSVNPSVVYVQVGTSWFRATTRQAQILSAWDVTRQLFELLEEPRRRRDRRAHNLKVDRGRYERDKLMMESLYGKEDISPAQEPSIPDQTEEKIKFLSPHWDEIEKASA